MRHIFFATAFVVPSYLSTKAMAADETGIDVKKTWSVVGVIADGASGIAVVKDRLNEKTFTVKVGEMLPGTDGFRIKSVERRQVVVTGEGQDLVLDQNVPTKDEREETNLSSFAENYFQGFPNPVDYYEQQGMNPDQPSDGEPLGQLEAEARQQAAGFDGNPDGLNQDRQPLSGFSEIPFESMGLVRREKPYPAHVDFQELQRRERSLPPPDSLRSETTAADQDNPEAIEDSFPVPEDDGYVVHYENFEATEVPEEED